MPDPWSNQAVNLIIVFGSTGFTGIFLYSPVPGAGNLIASVAAANGTDPYGNQYLQGVSSYDYSNFNVVNINSGAVNLATAVSVPAAIAAITGGFGCTVFAGVEGSLFLNSGGISNVDPQASVNITSAGAGGGSTRVSTLADKAVLNNSGGTIPIPGVSGTILTLPPDGNSGTTWVSGERAFMNNNWVANINSNFSSIITALQQAGIIT